MNATVKIEDATSFVAEPETALAVLTDTQKFDAFYSRVKAEVYAFVPDVSTAKGREAIKYLAFKVTKTKTAIDAARKKLTEDARKQVDAANAAGRIIWTQLEDLAAEARKPLTDWEEAEKARVEQVASRLRHIEQAGSVWTDDSAEAVADRIGQLEQMALDPDVFRDSLERAQAALEGGLTTLRALHARLVQEEADRAELTRLRREAADREAAEQAERDAKVAADAEAARQAKAKADEDARVEREAEARSLAAANAAEEARLAAEREAREAMETQQRQHQAELDRIQRARDAEVAEAARVAAETERREKNRAHVAKIMGAAKLAIMGLGVSEGLAVEVVKAIKAGSVPSVSIQF